MPPQPEGRWDVPGRRARIGRIGLQHNARSPHMGRSRNRATPIVEPRVWLPARASGRTGRLLSLPGLAGITVAAVEC